MLFGTRVSFHQNTSFSNFSKTNGIQIALDTCWQVERSEQGQQTVYARRGSRGIRIPFLQNEEKRRREWEKDERMSNHLSSQTTTKLQYWSRREVSQQWQTTGLIITVLAMISACAHEIGMPHTHTNRVYWSTKLSCHLVSIITSSLPSFQGNYYPSINTALATPCPGNSCLYSCTMIALHWLNH